MKGFPFRDRFGRLNFRPAGHGALIENLNDLQADLIYIKNVDNVVPDRLKELVCFWKKALGGHLVSIQEMVHSLLRRIKSPDYSRAVHEAAAFAANELLLNSPAGFEIWPEDKKRAFLFNLLDRPIRVCGVVPNAGEPGGAPFWVEDENGELYVQIVEKAQVDLNSPEQSAVWNSSTHFNPVDIVCCVRDYEGRPYDLRKFVDPKAVIITRKSKDAGDIQALELPGLWNGGMAHWITVLIEVPPATFNPVKSVYDLLGPSINLKFRSGATSSETFGRRRHPDSSFEALLCHPALRPHHCTGILLNHIHFLEPIRHIGLLEIGWNDPAIVPHLDNKRPTRFVCEFFELMAEGHIFTRIMHSFGAVPPFREPSVSGVPLTILPKALHLNHEEAEPADVYGEHILLRALGNEIPVLKPVYVVVSIDYSSRHAVTHTMPVII